MRLDRVTKLVEQANEREGWRRYEEIPARDMVWTPGVVERR